MLRSCLCDYSDEYIVVQGTITVEGTNNANARNKNLAFENNAPFRSCISKINITFIDNAENLHIVMPMYNLFEYSNNYSKTSESLWNYYRDEINDSTNENNDEQRIKNKEQRIKNNKTTTSKSFEYKTKIIGRIPNDNNILDAEVVVPLKYLNSFWRSLDLPLNNCEIELDLSWSRYCIISEISRTSAVSANLPVLAVEATHTTGATFQTNNAKLYVSAVTLSINDSIKFLENIKQGFKRTISWKRFKRFHKRFF